MVARFALAVIVIAVSTATATANGRPAASVSIRLAPDDADRLLLANTFGLLLSDDAVMNAMPALEIYHGDNLDVLARVPDASFQLVYVDPPFNTGKRRSLARTRSVRDDRSARVGFSNRRYRSRVVSRSSYADASCQVLLGSRTASGTPGHVTGMSTLKMRCR